MDRAEKIFHDVCPEDADKKELSRIGQKKFEVLVRQKVDAYCDELDTKICRLAFRKMKSKWVGEL